VEKQVDRFGKRAKTGDKEAKPPTMEILEPCQAARGGQTRARPREWTDEKARAACATPASSPASPCCTSATWTKGAATGNAFASGRCTPPPRARGSGHLRPDRSRGQRARPEERADFLADIGLDEPGLSKLARAAYKLLGLQTYFTAGEKEIRAWTIPVGAKAPRPPASSTPTSSVASSAPRSTASPIWSSTRPKPASAPPASCAVEGKEYVVQDGDIMHFLFNV
jgi:hypothetical protein